jgi:hypothetical protein
MRRFLFPALLAAASSAPAETVLPTGVVATSVVTLDPTRPKRTILGRLRYLGGVEIDSDDKRVGGFSSLKRYRGRLYAVTDVGHWAIIDPVERNGRLVGAFISEMGQLHGPDGAELRGTETGDAEAIARDGGGWLVGFEHDHKILRYGSLGGRGEALGLDPRAIFGELEENKGVETLAARRGRLFLCAERLPAEAPNCFIRSRSGDEAVRLPPSPGLDPETGYPVDADWGRDGTLYVLMRSWSGGRDNRAAIVARRPDGKLRTLALLVPPIQRDNYEGLAVRQEGRRTFLYVITDDNFGEYDEPGKPETWQRTLLLKFELVG